MNWTAVTQPLKFVISGLLILSRKQWALAPILLALGKLEILNFFISQMLGTLDLTSSQHWAIFLRRHALEHSLTFKTPVLNNL